MRSAAGPIPGEDAARMYCRICDDKKEMEKKIYNSVKPVPFEVYREIYAFNSDNVTLTLYNGDVLYSRDAYEGTALISFAAIVCYSFYVILKISRDDRLK